MRTCPRWYYLRGVATLPTVHWCETTSSNEGTAVGYSMQCCRGQGFSEHTCWRNNTAGRAGSPRGFTPHSPALSTFFRRAGMKKTPNSTGMCQMPTSQPRRTSPGGKVCRCTAVSSFFCNISNSMLNIICNANKSLLFFQSCSAANPLSRSRVSSQKLRLHNDSVQQQSNWSDCLYWFCGTLPKRGIAKM